MSDREVHMDIRSQKYMIALAENGSLSAAAKELGISQPALSTWLSQLEEEVGSPLVIRSHRNLSLTPAGNLYLKSARKMVLLRDAMFRDIQELSQNTPKVIRIGGTPNGGARSFARIYSMMKDLMPSVRLQFTECYNEEMMDLILKGKIDLGIGSAAELADSAIACYDPREREHILLIPEGYPGYYDPSSVKKDDEFPVADFSLLNGVPFIMPSREMSYYQALTRYFDSIHFQPNVIFSSANVSIIHDMITSGNGIGILPETMFSPLGRCAPYSLNPKLTGISGIFYLRSRQLSDAEKLILERDRSAWR